ncbi:MAG: universal stress protein [Candidatus Krumholzibacteria bacterium]|nr:universal stress protein [Candidatus Krumholzibacteria bacterium]
MTNEVKPISKALLYVDGSESSITAAQYAIVLSKKYGFSLKAIYVVNDTLLTELLGAKVFVKMEKMDYERDLEEDGKRYLNYVVKLGERKGVKVQTALRKGIVHEEISREVEESECSLLIQGELGEVLSLRDSFYEEGERILRKVSCAVLVVKNKKNVDWLYDSI